MLQLCLCVIIHIVRCLIMVSSVCRADLDAKLAEHEALKQAKAEVETQLADAHNSLAELTGQRDELEASLLRTKATLKSTEESLKTANVSRIS